MDGGGFVGPGMKAFLEKNGQIIRCYRTSASQVEGLSLK